MRLMKASWAVTLLFTVSVLSACSPPAESAVSNTTTLAVLDEFIAIHPLHLFLNTSSSSEEISVLNETIGVICLSLESGIPRNVIIQELRGSRAFTAIQLDDLISLSVKHQCPSLD